MNPQMTRMMQMLSPPPGQMPEMSLQL